MASSQSLTPLGKLTFHIWQENIINCSVVFNLLFQVLRAISLHFIICYVKTKYSNMHTKYQNIIINKGA